MQFGTSLPTGGTGMKGTLSQGYCKNNPGVCGSAHWAGFHLETTKCIHYGNIEIDVAFDMNSATEVRTFLGTYIYEDAQDNAWNEIDLGWSARSAFTSPYMTLAYLTPGNGKTWLEKKQDFDSSNGYTKSMNRSMLTYRIEWRKGKISWYVNG